MAESTAGLIENVVVDLMDFFRDVYDDPDTAMFGEYADVGPREWDGDAISFTVSSREGTNAVQVIVRPAPDTGSRGDGAS